jgi:hypothetical protein
MGAGPQDRERHIGIEGENIFAGTKMEQLEKMAWHEFIEKLPRREKKIAKLFLLAYSLPEIQRKLKWSRNMAYETKQRLRDAAIKAGFQPGGWKPRQNVKDRVLRAWVLPKERALAHVRAEDRAPMGDGVGRVARP